MKILCIGQLEDRKNIDKQILKQTVQPDRVIFYIDESPAKGIPERRKRIADNHKKLREIVEAYPEYDLIWQVEGDSLYTSDTLESLIRNYQQWLHLPSFGYVSGVQLGRHGIYALGAWHIPEDKQSFTSIDHKLNGLHKVDATGFYCLLAPRDVWLKGEVSWQGEPWGPDVNFGLSLRNQGYDIWVDMDLHVGHKTKRGEIWPNKSMTENVTFYRKDNRWEYRTS